MFNVQIISEYTTLLLKLQTLDIAILCNSSPKKFNIMPIDDATKGEYTSLQFYSTRDIEKDEEILMDYSIYRVRFIAV